MHMILYCPSINSRIFQQFTCLIKFLKITEFQESYLDRSRITKSLDLIILKNFLEKFKKFKKLKSFFKYLRIKNKFLKFVSFLFNISRLYLFK